MAKGKKLDLFIGADFDEGWGMVSDEKSTAQSEILPPQKHQLVFKKEKRRGKPVTLVGPFFVEKTDATGVLKRLKKTLGCGGTVKEEWMEFQGDVEPKLRDLLVAEGFRLKR